MNSKEGIEQLIEKGKNTRFKKAPQGLDEAKSKGQVERAKKTNLLCTARTLFENANILPDLVDNLKEEVQEGETKNAIKFFDVIKEPEKQELKTTIEGMPTTFNILPVKAKNDD